MSRQDAKNAKEGQKGKESPFFCLPWRSWRLGGSLFLLSVLATLSCGPRPTTPASAAPPADFEAKRVAFCGRCHALPPPDALPRAAWKENVEQMYRFFGQAQLPIVPPPIDDVVRFYEQGAPEALPEAVVERAAHPSPFAFARTALPPLPLAPLTERPGPHVSNVTIATLSDRKTPQILVCEMSVGAIFALDPREAVPSWRVLARSPAVSHPAHVEVVDLDGDGIQDLLVADLGSYYPSDRILGSVVWLRGKADGSYEPHTLLDGVGRVADVQAADFDGDGKLDLAVACFGWRLVGEVLVLFNRTTDGAKPTFEKRVVDKRHGAIHVPVVDLNGDGKPDFVALLAQEHEEVVAFLNDGKGTFRPETIYKAPHPGWGSSGIQLVDLNGDGKRDVLFTNGDVLDTPHVLKAFHGVQWLENPGNGSFPWKHHALTPFYGAHRAVAGDLNGDGRRHVVAVGLLPDLLFPQRETQALDSIVVLEQAAAGRFARHTLETKTCDHVTCALGDLFGTGRLDLVVGSFSAPRADCAVALWRNVGAKR